MDADKKCKQHQPIAIEFVPIFTRTSIKVKESKDIDISRLIASKIYCPSCGMVQQLDIQEIAKIQ